MGLITRSKDAYRKNIIVGFRIQGIGGLVEACALVLAQRKPAWRQVFLSLSEEPRWWSPARQSATALTRVRTVRHIEHTPVAMTTA